MMAAKKAATQRVAIDISEAEKQFETVARAARAMESSGDKTQSLLATSLQELYDFGQLLRADDDLLAAFFEAKGIKLNKATRTNPYNGLVHLAFSDKVKKSMRSKYARTLHYVHDSRTNKSVKSWIATNGIDECYRQAVEQLQSSLKGHKGAARHLRVASGKANLDNLVVSEVFDLSETLEPGYVRAILKVGSSGQTAEVASVIETRDAEWNEIFAQFASAQASRHQALMGNPLFPVFRAVEIIRAFAPESDKTGHVLIRSLTDGGNKTSVIEFVSQRPAFRCARMILGEPLDLPDDCNALLTMSDAASFVQTYPKTADWKITTNALASSKLSLPLSDLAQSQIAFRAARFEGHKSNHFLMPIDILGAATKPGVLAARTASSKPKSPDRLAFDADGKVLSVRNISLLGATLPLFETQTLASPIADDRFLALKDLAALARAFLPYQVDLDGCLLSYSAPDEALLLRRDFGGDKLEIVIPMVVDAKLNTTFEYDELRP